MTVSHYGIHRDNDGIAWLVQSKSTVNAIGLKARASLEYALPDTSFGRGRCNHNVDLTRTEVPEAIWSQVRSSIKDPLFQIMLPLPKQHRFVGFVPQESEKIVADLARMTSPIRGVMLPVWAAGETVAAFKNLGTTNIQPLVLTDVSLLDMPMLRQLTDKQSQLPRQLVVMSQLKEMIIPAGMAKITTRLKPHPNWPWERIGAKIILNYMRGEEI